MQPDRHGGAIQGGWVDGCVDGWVGLVGGWGEVGGIGKGLLAAVQPDSNGGAIKDEWVAMWVGLRPSTVLQPRLQSPSGLPLPSRPPHPLQGIADGRVNLLGRMALITDEAERAAAKKIYMANHPNSFWWVLGKGGLSGWAAQCKREAGRGLRPSPPPTHTHTAPTPTLPLQGGVRRLQPLPDGGGCDGSPGGWLCAGRQGASSGWVGAWMGEWMVVWLLPLQHAASLPPAGWFLLGGTTPPLESHTYLRTQVTAEEYAAAAVDPIYKFSAPVAGHMNADHADATRAMVKHYVGITGVPGVGELGGSWMDGGMQGLGAP